MGPSKKLESVKHRLYVAGYSAVVNGIYFGVWAYALNDDDNVVFEHETFNSKTANEYTAILRGLEDERIEYGNYVTVFVSNPKILKTIQRRIVETIDDKVFFPYLDAIKIRKKIKVHFKYDEKTLYTHYYVTYLAKFFTDREVVYI